MRTDWGWPEEIGKSVLLRQQLHEQQGDLQPFTIPGVAADHDRLADAERRLGFQLDPCHRELLTFANGWPYFFNFTHLFSTDVLGQSQPESVWTAANAILDIFFEGGSPVPDLPDRAELYVISANPGEEADIFVVWRTGRSSSLGRQVSWLAEGEEIQRFEDCWQMLLSCDAYLESNVADAS